MKKRTKIILLLALVLAAPFLWILLTRAISPLFAHRIVRLESSANTPAAVHEPLKVMCYNIAHGRGPDKPSWEEDLESGEAFAEKTKRIDAMIERIRLIKPDILVLNEVDFNAYWSQNLNQARYIARKLDLPWCYEQVNYDFNFPFRSIKHGNAVLSRFEIVEWRELDFPSLSQTEKLLLGYKRGAICTLKIGDQLLDVMPVHLEHRSEPPRIASARAILEDLAHSNRPTLLLGDFNSKPDPIEPTALSLLLENNTLHTYPQAGQYEHYLTHPSKDLWQKIDWILATPDIRILSETVPPWPESDHLPVVGEVLVGGE